MRTYAAEHLLRRPTWGSSNSLRLHAAKRTQPAQILFLLFATVSTLPALAFINARGGAITAGWVGLCEAMVFAWCILLQRKHIPVWAVVFGLGLLAWMVFTWLIRQQIDLKSARDLMIPILFISLGRCVADGEFAEDVLRRITFLVLAMAVLEVFFTTSYGVIFNTFSFYAGLGSIRESAAMFDGQTLTLNGFRPEGIGRTFLSGLLGTHRASSVFLEPVSLGNFAVILLAWNLSTAWKNAGLYRGLMCLVALVLIVLSDSRFGMLMAAVLVIYRLLPQPAFAWLAPAYPLLLLAGIVGVASLSLTDGDNFAGRISLTGQALIQLNETALMGLASPLPGFGDMGYAYVITRYGVLTVVCLVVALFWIPVASDRAGRFRAMVVLYCFSSLAISGTSVFALKTAGLMWFVFGALAADTHPLPASRDQGL